jgi:hypothetical protein
VHTPAVAATPGVPLFPRVGPAAALRRGMVATKPPEKPGETPQGDGNDHGAELAKVSYQIDHLDFDSDTYDE